MRIGEGLSAELREALVALAQTEPVDVEREEALRRYARAVSRLEFNRRGFPTWGRRSLVPPRLPQGQIQHKTAWNVAAELLSEEWGDDYRQADVLDTIIEPEDEAFVARRASMRSSDDEDHPDPVFELVAARDEAGSTLRRLAGDPVVVEIDEALLCVYDRVEDAHRQRGLAHDLLSEVAGHPTNPDVLIEIHDLVQRHIDHFEQEAAGRPLLIRPVSSSPRKQRWATENQIRLANDDRCQAAAAGRDTAAKRPGRDMFAKRGRVLYFFDPTDPDTTEAAEGPVSDNVAEDARRLVQASINPEPTDEECSLLLERSAQKDNVTAAELRGKSRARRLTGPRKNAIKLMNENNCSNAQIARMVDRDPAYITHVLREAKEGPAANR